MQPWREASSLIIVTRASVRAAKLTSSSNIIQATTKGTIENVQNQLLQAHNQQQQQLQDSQHDTTLAQYSSSSSDTQNASIPQQQHNKYNSSNSSNSSSSNNIVADNYNSNDTVDIAGDDVQATRLANDNCDYRLMMVKRSGLSSFLASAYVFPGGRVEPADFSARWWTLFNKFNLTRDDLALFSNSIKGSRPPIVTNPLIVQESVELREQGSLPADIGLRIAALRETFEETGVLLLTKPGDDADSYQPLSDNDSALNVANVDLSAWRDNVRKDAAAFLDLCLETNLCPNIWSLYEWWNWLTPTSVGHKRCDTMFYVCFLEVEPKVVLDNEEVTTLKWCTPTGMLDEHSTADVFLAPPQVYELSRLCNFTEFDALRQFSAERQALGIQRWLPVISTYQDGAVALLPGDEFYPETPDVLGRKPVPDNPQTLAEFGSRAKIINRLEIRGPVCHARANIKLPNGHPRPKSHQLLELAVLSPMV